MQAENGHKYIGVVLGKILKGSHTLVYGLYEREDGTQYTRISQYVRYADTRVSVAGLALALDKKVVDVWETTYDVPWYFIQLEQDCGTEELRGFALPMAAHFGTWRRMEPV